jgi:H+/Cl- antiporter ClcA
MPSILIGLLSLIFVIFMVGSVSAAFLYCMSQAQSLFLSHPLIVWLLPVIGLLTGAMYTRWGRTVPSTARILFRAHDERPLIPFITAALIFCFTILSQCFGASTGRESTAVQFGAALAEWVRDLSRKHTAISRESFIRCGLAAGFAAVFGVPWAGTIFALEATPGRKWNWRYIPLTLVSAFGAHSVATAWGASHKAYPVLKGIAWDWHLGLQWLCFGFVFGIAARVFLTLLRFTEHSFTLVKWGSLRPALGGLCIALLTALIFQSTRYNGLGIPLIDASFAGTVGFFDFIWKSLFTLISTGSGLRGGEVTPLMAAGASLGAVLGGWLSAPVIYGASIGLVSVFASAAHIPWTGAVMAWEFFGFEAFLPTFIVCFIARQLVGRRGLFSLLPE